MIFYQIAGTKKVRVFPFFFLSLLTCFREIELLLYVSLCLLTAPGPKIIPTREESASIVECFLLIPAEERTFVNSNLTVLTASVSIEDVPSDSEGEGNNSPIIPARSLGVSLFNCCLRGFKVCFLISLLLFAVMLPKPVAVGRESSRSSFAKRWESKTRAIAPIVMPSLGGTSKAKEPEAPVKERSSSNLKRKRADALGHDFASPDEDTTSVVWPEMKHLLDERVAEGYSTWDLDDVFNEAGANAYKV